MMNAEEFSAIFNSYFKSSKNNHEIFKQIWNHPVWKLYINDECKCQKSMIYWILYINLKITVVVLEIIFY